MRLARRERYLISVAACCVAIFLVFQFLIFPFFENRRRIQRGLKAKEKGLEEIVKLRGEYQAYQKGAQGIQQTIARRQKGFTLFSFLEKAAGEAEVKAHIKSMKPSISSGTGPYKESMVEMKLEGITLQQLVGYLYRIESPDDIVNIKRISISQNKKAEGYLDAILQVVTFQ
ncbi:MAG: type II secretion system protein M [Deltaproteobacteria bacterium]|nr:type II secretion system protein M [Deltaproteobacteria bacterium]MBW1794306.1 type II secretion system protein M [Deltaproteobacteria bacterium]